MDHAARVRELDREADVGERAQQALPERLGVGASRGSVGERRAGELLHREERLAVAVAAELVDRHDRRVIEPALDLRLAQEPLDQRRAPLAARIRLIATSRPICSSRAEHDLAHPAAADQLAEPVADAGQRGRALDTGFGRRDRGVVRHPSILRARRHVVAGRVVGEHLHDLGGAAARCPGSRSCRRRRPWRARRSCGGPRAPSRGARGRGRGRRRCTAARVASSFLGYGALTVASHSSTKICDIW